MATTTPHRNSFLSNRPSPPIKSPIKSPQSSASSNITTPSSTSALPETTPKPKFVPPPANSFAFTLIPVLSLPRAQSFYATVFGWTFQPQASASQLIFFTPSSVMGALSLIPGTDAAPESGSESEKNGEKEKIDLRAGGVVNHILVADVAATLQKVVEAGGMVEKERWVEGGHTELGRFWDTEGNLGGVLKWLI
ncbi:hypothetical protein BU16DRAFT_612496 [Lophium mytilinum]|uniref:Glyoxalase/fosfomycin resistance/dioxygenase domain-containing protein n=1 Tax=Lophium mytilinum TaxID=390894 RepID=A0A6A6RGL9_9PEZI|nr:hypothetical protein BU16DRAFT_612496 [Lophium mytilinum]